MGSANYTDSKVGLVFLGGTCGKNNWREAFISEAIAKGISSEKLFNPVVSDWNEAAQEREEKAKAEATHMVFYLADPLEEGNNISFYSGIEATMALYDKPETTVVIFDSTGMGKHHAKAMTQSCKLLKARFPDANIFDNRDAAVNWLAEQ